LGQLEITTIKHWGREECLYNIFTLVVAQWMQVGLMPSPHSTWVEKKMLSQNKGHQDTRHKYITSVSEKITIYKRYLKHSLVTKSLFKDRDVISAVI